MLSAKGEFSRIEAKRVAAGRSLPCESSADYTQRLKDRQRDRNHALNGSRDQSGAAIKRIAIDNTSGAAEILNQAGDVFSLLNTGQPDASAEQAHRAVFETCIALARAQPAMSPLLRMASAVILAARKATTPQEVLMSAETAARGFRWSAERAAHTAAQRAARMITAGAKVLTHSRSSTVMEAFLEARRAGTEFSVIATESRPMFEGRALAEELADLVHVTLIADAAASLAMAEVDLVLVGADMLAPAYLVNKIGTRMIALAARERERPIYAVCDTSKFISGDYMGHTPRRERAAAELWPDAPAGITVMNRYFEPIPLGYFTGIVTEDGTLSGDDAARRAEEASIDEALMELLARLPGSIR